jgi:3'-5' exoribonuclease 1
MKQYIVLDLEATCYDRGDNNKPKGFVNEITEIGAFKLNEQGEVIDSFSKFLKPKKFPFISKFCNELTTITQDDIDYADDAKQVLNEFFDWARISHPEPIYVSWGHYDKRQLRDDLKVNGFPQDLIDVLISDKNHISLKHWYGDFKKMKKAPGLGRAIEMEKMIFEGTAHRGIDDAKNIVKIFNRYIQYI